MKKTLLFLLALFCVLLPRAGAGIDEASGFSPRSAAHSSPAEDKMALDVTHNNPFNPSRGQATKFRFYAKGVNRVLRVRVYTPSGVLVREFPEQLAAVNTPYEITWDGKNDGGQVVARGIYLVNLQERDTFSRGLVRKIAVVK